MSTDLIREIYASVAEPGRMANIMSTVGQALKAESSFLFTSHSVSSPDALLLGHNMSPEAVEDFATVWCHHDVWAHEAGRRSMMRRNVVVTGDDLVAADELHRSTFYNEYGKAAGMDAMLGTILFDGTERGGEIPFTNLCWYRGPGKARFDVNDKKLLRPLMPHLQQALLLHHQLHRLGVQQLLAGADARRPHLASLVIDDEARIVARNASAEGLLTGRAPLVAAVAERITDLGRKAVPSLPDALTLCRTTGAAVQLLIQEPASGRLFRATLSAIAADAPSYAGVFAGPHYLLVIELPGEPNLDLVVKAGQLYGFTPSEAAVALLLVRGLSVEQTALERGSSVNTVRTQVRALLHKTGHERQIDMLLTLGQLVYSSA